MAKKNKHGLSRRIPDGVAKLVRQTALYGCVVCGQIPYQYEHVDPEFADARTHDPTNMTLLCASHNEQKRKGLLTIADVRHHQANPHSARAKYAAFRFVEPREQFGWQLPGIRYVNTGNVITCDGRPIFSLTGGDTPDEPLSLNAVFKDQFGRKVCSIERNEIRIFGSVIDDFEQNTTRFSVTYVGNEVGELDFDFLPEDKIVKFRKLTHYDKGCAILASENETRLYSGKIGARVLGIEIRNARSAIALYSANSLQMAVANRNLYSFSGGGAFDAIGQADGISVGLNGAIRIF